MVAQTLLVRTSDVGTWLRQGQSVDVSGVWSKVRGVVHECGNAQGTSPPAIGGAGQPAHRREDAPEEICTHDPTENPVDCVAAALRELAGGTVHRPGVLLHGLAALAEIERQRSLHQPTCARERNDNLDREDEFTAASESWVEADSQGRTMIGNPDGTDEQS